VGDHKLRASVFVERERLVQVGIRQLFVFEPIFAIAKNSPACRLCTAYEEQIVVRLITSASIERIVVNAIREEAVVPI
jgi:hypothetical protein